MLGLIAIRIVVDALVARFVLGARASRFWRGFAAIVVGDALVFVLGSGVLFAISRQTSGPGARETTERFGVGALIIVAMLLVWVGVLRLAASATRSPLGRTARAAVILLVAGVIEILGLGFIQQVVDPSAAVTEWQVRVPNLPPAFDGLRVCCIADLHVHCAADRRRIRDRLWGVADTHADLILFLGDYGTGPPRYMRDAAAMIAELDAPLGVYAVLGNHEHYARDFREVKDTFREAGVRLLLNRSLPLQRGHDTLYLAGVDDPYTWNDDLDAALEGVPPRSCVILMAHAPDILAKAQGRVSLVVAGHTHGGQICLPVLGPPKTGSRYGYTHGLYRWGRTVMFVTRGAGELFPYLRINCPREIAVLTLRPG